MISRVRVYIDSVKLGMSTDRFFKKNEAECTRDILRVLGKCKVKYIQPSFLVHDLMFKELIFPELSKSILKSLTSIELTSDHLPKFELVPSLSEIRIKYDNGAWELFSLISQ